MTATKYSGYAPLDVNRNEIRILVVEADPKSQSIVCSLVPVPLSQANPFYALSYVWGNTDDMRSIILDQQIISTRKNLYEFLHSLTTTFSGPIRVWVDYLCINQDDLDERNSQVAMMGRIYAAADSVYAWLGPSTLESQQVYDFVDRAHHMRHDRVPYSRIYDSDLGALNALDDIIDRQYWTRLWIIQEIVLAKRLWLFCGNKFIEWDDLPFIIAGRRPEPERTASDSLRLLQYLKETRETKTVLPYSDLVHKFAAAHCQDGRDKLYGLLALAPADIKDHILVDYRKPLLQVLLETFEHWASEWTLDQGIRSVATGIAVSYPPAQFCHEISMLFPDAALLDLYDQPKERARVSSGVVLRGIWQNEQANFKPIATIDAKVEQLMPIVGGLTTTVNDVASGIVSQMVTLDGLSTFAFTTVRVLQTDKILHLGALILVVRQTGLGMSVVGRGIQQTCSPAEQIFDPCTWLAQLLPDSKFEICAHARSTSLGHHSMRRKDQQVDIQLNAAALVELLISCRPQEQTWDPYDFGIEHRIVDLCTHCRLRLHAIRRRAVDKRRHSSCRCIWAGGDQALSAHWRKMRRHYSLPVGSTLSM